MESPNYNKKTIAILISTLTLIVLTQISSIGAIPILKQNNNINKNDNIPNIEDILAVAKSPLEPITVAMSLPGARNDDTLTSQQPEVMTTKSESHKQTSRAALFVEQERETSSTSSLVSTTQSSLAVSGSGEQEKKEQTEATATTTLSPGSESTETESSETDSTDSTELDKEKDLPTTTTAAATTTTITSTTTTTTTTLSTTEKPETTSAVEELESTTLPTTTTAAEAEAGPEITGSELPTKTETKEEPASSLTSTSTSTSSSSSTSTSKVESSEIDNNSAATSTIAPVELPSTTESPAPVSSTEQAHKEVEEKETITNDTKPTTTTDQSIIDSSNSNQEKSQESSVKEVTKLATNETEPTTTTPLPSSETKVEEPTTTASPAVAESSEAVSPAITTTTTTTTTEETLVESTPVSVPKVQDETVISEKETTELDGGSSPITTTTSTTTTTLSPTTTTTESPTTEKVTTERPTEKPAEKEEKNNQQSQASCNHLPTYDQDELQKVFREETTYKNGTIKGKFTYINYDQRYRLVHYTRLPYGPVKIDLVEELGKLEQNQGATQNNNNNNNNLNGNSLSNNNQDVPNAVLQLRNILPNSLFGFPFLGPVFNNYQHHNNNNPFTPKDDKSNQYFYSTDSISTPNLLTPSVPVSLLPGQRRAPQQGAALNAPAADTLGQSYYENLPVNSMITFNQKQQQHSPSSDSQSQQGTNKMSQSSIEINQKPGAQNHFQYALVSAPEVAKQQANLVYTYVQPQQQAQYQYSQVPIFHTFNHQPSFYSAIASHHHQQQQQQLQQQQQQSAQPALMPLISSVEQTIQKQKQQDEAASMEPLLAHQAHQPHSHEHFVAPFMLGKAPTTTITTTTSGGNAQQPLNDEPNRLKLRVKSSKSLNHQDSFGKSAQIKAQNQRQLHQQQLQLQSPGTYLQSPFYNPIQILRYNQRHRSGKQQQFDLKQQNINNNPIVYHVRSPVGKMYTLQQYQAHSLAFDHED